ncbi:MAG: metallophosphoesterase, partial [Bryobacteraceae bacterium]
RQMQLRNLLTILILAAGGAAGQTSFTTIETWTDPVGSCGSPGLRACFSLKASCTPNSSVRIDPYTGQDNCDLSSPSCTAFPLPVNYANPDFTFLVITDTHLLNGYSTSDADHVRNTYNLNLLPSLGFNWSQAGAGFDNKPLGSPSAVVTTGDDTNYGQQTDLGGYRLLYELGLTSDSLNYLVFPGLGNHDVQGQCEFANCGRRMFDYVAAAASCAAHVDNDSHNYSWDWGPFHMIQLNEWAGSTNLGSDTATNYKPTHGSGLNWLAQDLLNSVGSSGRPVILFQHFGWDYFSLYNNDFSGQTDPWWSAADRQRLLNILAPYHIAALFSGHQHQTGMYGVDYTDSSGHPRILDDFTGGTGGINGNGEFFAVRLTQNFLDVLPFKWSDSLNGTQPFMTSVGEGSAGPVWPGGQTWNPGTGQLGSGPQPDGTPTYPLFYNNVNGCRKWIGPSLAAAPVTISFDPTDPYSVIIKNNTGSTIQGPFALQLNVPSGGTLKSVSFMGSCSQGPAFQEFSSTQLTPGATDKLTLNVLGYSASPNQVYTLSDFSVVTLGADSFVASQSQVTVTASSSTQVDLSTVFGHNVAFTSQVFGSGYTVSANSTQTPATITIAVNPNAAKVDQTASVAITPTNVAYGPAKVTVNLGATPITVSSRANDVITVDGKSYPSPQIFNWRPNDQHTLDAPPVQASTGTQDRISSWSNGANQRQQITVPFSPATYTATFLRYYLVTPTASPAAGGSVISSPASADGYYADGTALTVTATPNSGYVFSAFQGAGSVPAGNSFSTVVGKPLTFTAVFKPVGTYTIETNVPSNGAETVDGTAYTGPASLSWTQGSSHSFSVPAEIDPAAGVRYIFTGWSDGTTSASRSVTAGATTDYVANYQLQYQVTIGASPVGGGLLAGGGWFNAGAQATLTATAAAGFTFAGFSGDISGSQDPQALTVSKPDNVIANFQPGVPVLSASAGPRDDSNPAVSGFTFILSNTGPGAAANAQIDSVSATTALGTGVVAAPPGAMVFGTIPPSQSASQVVTVSWPSTATRVAFTVKFSANGGTYHGQSTFYVFR